MVKKYYSIEETLNYFKGEASIFDIVDQIRRGNLKTCYYYHGAFAYMCQEFDKDHNNEVFRYMHHAEKTFEFSGYLALPKIGEYLLDYTLTSTSKNEKIHTFAGSVEIVESLISRELVLPVFDEWKQDYYTPYSHSTEAPCEIEIRVDKVLFLSSQLNILKSSFKVSQGLSLKEGEDNKKYHSLQLVIGVLIKLIKKYRRNATQESIALDVEEMFKEDVRGVSKSHLEKIFAEANKELDWSKSKK